MLALLVVLMACVFSTLDNAVTLRHAGGTDIGQWPRLLLALSGLAAGFVFDIRKRKYMGLVMYCVMMLSVLSIVVLNLGGPFLIGLVVFYLSSVFSLSSSQRALWSFPGICAYRRCGRAWAAP